MWFFVDVGACDGLRIARELELSTHSLSACVRRAPCGSAVNPERASDFDLHFRHAPCHAASASRFHILEDTQNVIPPLYTVFKMPLGRFACLEILPQFLPKLMRSAACPSRRTTTSRTSLPLLSTVPVNPTLSRTSELDWFSSASLVRSVSIICEKLYKRAGN